jgi:hypothetical protein
MTTEKTVKLGKIAFEIGYVVDLNDPDMVAHAKEAILEDIMYAYKNSNEEAYIKTLPADDAEESDIPSFLIEETEED